MERRLRAVGWCLLALASLASSVAGQRVGRARGWVRANVGGGGWFERIRIGSDGTMVACSDLAGAYVSRDGGAHWSCVGPARGLEETHVGCAAFDPADPSIVFLGTEQGVFRSADGARSFARTLASGYVESIAVAPTDSSVVYAAWHPGFDSLNPAVQRSGDGGVTWAPVSIDLPSNLRLLKLLVDRGNPDRLFAFSGSSRFRAGHVDLLRSDDGGAHWVSIGGTFGGRIVDVALDPFDPMRLWCSVDDPNPDARGHLYRSDDRGGSWTELARRGGAIWLDVETPGTIRMIEARYLYPWDPREGIFESSQGGSAGTFQKKSSVTTWDSGWSTAPWAFNATSLHGALAPHPLDASRMVWVTTQFVFGTRDGGASVEPLYTRRLGSGPNPRYRSTGIDNVVVVDIDVSDADPDLVTAAFFDLGIWRSFDGGHSWSAANDAIHSGAWGGAGGNSWFVVSDPAQWGVVWAGQGDDPYGPMTLLRSSDAGSSWSAVGAGLPAVPLLGLSLDPGSPPGMRTLFLTAGGDVWRSTDDGNTWTRVLVEGGLRFTAVDRFDSGIVYAGGEDGLWASLAGGNPGSWSEVGTAAMRGGQGGEPDSSWEGVFDIEPDPSVPGGLWVAAVGTGKGLFQSADHGTTWTKVLSGDFLRTVALDPLHPNHLVVGGSSAFDSGGWEPGSPGVLESSDRGASWHPLRRGLAWPFALDLALDPADPSRVFLASPGAGIHILEPSSPKK